MDHDVIYFAVSTYENGEPTVSESATDRAAAYKPLRFWLILGLMALYFIGRH